MIGCEFPPKHILLNMKRKQDGVKPDTGAPVAVSGDHADQVVIRPLGAGQEVGRSCFLLRYQGKGVMFDCGIHPAYTGKLCCAKLLVCSVQSTFPMKERAGTRQCAYVADICTCIYVYRLLVYSPGQLS